MLLQKTFVEDYLTHKTVKNTGQLPQYFVEDHHDPIVPKEVYFQVQGEIMRRKKQKDPTKVRKAEECGRMLYRLVRNDVAEWRYRGIGAKKEDQDCKCRMIREEELRRAVEEALSNLDYDDLIRRRDELKLNLVRLDAMIECKEGEEKDRLTLERAELANTLMQIRLLMELVDGKEKEQSADGACRDYEEFFERTRERCECFAERVIRYVDRVLVHDEKVEVLIKGGVKVEVEDRR